jgi:hypothetical protein
MPQVHVKRSGASLVGGIAIAVGVLVLFLMHAGTGTAALLAGLVVAGAVGAWVRLADL